MGNDSSISKSGFYKLLGVYGSAIPGMKRGEVPDSQGFEALSDAYISGAYLSGAQNDQSTLEESLEAWDNKSEGQAGQKSMRNDSLRLKDGYDSSRDITGVFVDEGAIDEPYRIRVSVGNLREGAAAGNLDLYTLLSIGENGRHELPDNIPGSSEIGWNIAIGAYDGKKFKVVDDQGNVKPGAIKSMRFDPLSDSVEFTLDKSVLREKGWSRGKPLSLQLFTTKDLTSQITDSLDMPSKKPWLNEGRLTARMDPKDPQNLIAKRDENWEDDLIYFVFTDRYKDGDRQNNQDVDKNNLNKDHGGDLQGIIESLDYLKSRNVTTLWISPVMTGQKEFMSSAGYHGYWPLDFYGVDPRQGTLEKFRELITEAHSRGLKVILDIPLNHVAWEHQWAKDPGKYNWFHHTGDIKDWNDDKNVEEGSLYGLPDLAQENPEVYAELLKVSKFWVDMGVDGFRLDAVRHIPRDFWDKLDKDIHDYAGSDFLLMGEYFHGWEKKLAPYQSDGMDSLFDMPLMFTMRDVLAKDGSMKLLAGRLADEERELENPAMMSAFLDNHDTPRFITYAGENGREKLKLALAFLMTVNRIPAIYYGTEVGMEGDHNIMTDDMSNRKDMEFGKDPELQAYFDRLAGLRKSSESLRKGALLEMWRDDKVFAFSRITPDDETIVLLNNDYEEQYREVPLRAESGIKNGAVLTDALTGRKYGVEKGKIKITLGRKQPVILTGDGTRR